MYVITRTWSIEKDGKGRTQVLAVRRDAALAMEYALKEANAFAIPDETIIMEENRVLVKAKKKELILGPACFEEEVEYTRVRYDVTFVTAA